MLEANLVKQAKFEIEFEFAQIEVQKFRNEKNAQLEMQKWPDRNQKEVLPV